MVRIVPSLLLLALYLQDVHLNFLTSDEEILPGFASEIKIVALFKPIENKSSIVSSLADLFEHFK